MGSAEGNLILMRSQKRLATQPCYMYHSPALAVYTPMYMVWATFIISGISLGILS